jgi:UDPglucose--hexose-1-phosphate uridylyltransferase
VLPARERGSDVVDTPHPSRRRPAKDTTREAGPHATASREQSQPGLVWNPFWGEFVAQSPGRMQRRELTADCPFCADRTTGRVPSDAQAWVRPNDFPAIRPPAGEAYVLVYSADHSRTFAELSVPEVVRIIGLWQEVYRDLSARYAAVLSWETSGEAIGQTQRHPHGQTFGLAVVPDLLARELAAVEHAARAGEPCPFCAEVEHEAEGPRVVASGDHWLAFVPPYARYPYQVRVTPRAHVPHIGAIPLDGAVVEELARTLLTVVLAYNVVYQAPMPYMLALHQLADPRFHVHFELLPVGRAPGKLKFPAGSESAYGFWLNDAVPDAKAAELRAAMQ